MFFLQSSWNGAEEMIYKRRSHNKNFKFSKKIGNVMFADFYILINFNHTYVLMDSSFTWLRSIKSNVENIQSSVL